MDRRPGPTVGPQGPMQVRASGSDRHTQDCCSGGLSSSLQTADLTEPLQGQRETLPSRRRSEQGRCSSRVITDEHNKEA